MVCTWFIYTGHTDVSFLLEFLVGRRRELVCRDDTSLRRTFGKVTTVENRIIQAVKRCVECSRGVGWYTLVDIFEGEGGC